MSVSPFASVVLGFENESPEALLQKLLEAFKKYSKDPTDLIQRAFALGMKVHVGQVRESGAPYLTHPLIVARLLMPYQPDRDTLIATILHDAFEDSSDATMRSEVRHEFGEHVAALIEGVSKISKEYSDDSTLTTDEETIRKMFRHAEKDVRIILIKLADRLHNIITLETKKGEEKRRQKAQETLEIFVPVATRLGLWELKTHLEESCFSFLHPEEAKQLQSQIDLHKEDAMQMFSSISEKLGEHPSSGEILSVKKQNYDLPWLFARKGKQLAPEETFFVKLVVSSEDECYRVLTKLGRLYTSKTRELKDYITSPKDNGYRALHASMIVNGSFTVRFHILTREMEERNMKGIALDLHDEAHLRSFFQHLRSIDRATRKESSRFIEAIQGDMLSEKILIHHESGKTYVPSTSSALDAIFLLFPEKGDLTDFLRQCDGENPAGAIFDLMRRYTPPSPQERLCAELRESNSSYILPVQAFHDGIAYYTIPLQRRKETILYTITSKREIFPCTPDAFADRKLGVLRLPLLDTSRWNQQQLLDYLGGKEPVSLGDLFNLLTEMVLKVYVELPEPRFYSCITLWIMATYFYRIFHAFPYLHLYGEFHSGKTKVLQMAVLLSFNGEMLTSTTAAALIRLIHFNGATCGIDEAEKLENDRDEAAAVLLEVLRCGYKKGATVPRCEGDKESFKVVRYDPYSPKVIAGTKPLESALSSRCIQILMLRSRNHQMANREVNVGSTDWSDYRSLLYAAALSSFKDVQSALLGTEFPEIIGRDAEIWRPILVMAKVADPSGVLFQEMYTLAKETQELRKKEEEDTVTPKVIACLFELLKGKECDFLPAETIFEALLAHDEEFGWLNDLKYKHSRGRWLNRTLKKMNLWHSAARLKSIYGEKKKGYDLEASKLREIAERYSITLAPTPSESVTSVTDTSLPF